MVLKGQILLAYVAGIVDGEGTIGLHKNYEYKGRPFYGLRVSVGNTNEWLISFLKMQFGGYVFKETHSNPLHKDCWKWELHAKKSYVFLKAILPYLQIKRPQAELAIRFQNRRQRYKIRNEQAWFLDEEDKVLMASYNKRGKQEAGE